MLDCVSKPRRNGRSPAGLPPSPAPSVMPGVVRRASISETEPVCWITSDEITVMDLGVSSSGAVNLPELALSTLTSLAVLPVTLTAGSTASLPAAACWATAGRAAIIRPTAAAGCTRLAPGLGCLRDLMYDMGFLCWKRWKEWCGSGWRAARGGGWRTKEAKRERGGGAQNLAVSPSRQARGAPGIRLLLLWAAA